MMRAPFLSDNPFRMVGTGSSIDVQALRRRVDQLARSATVGIETPPPMLDLLGVEDWDTVASTVRSLQTDPTRRLAFRIMWPLDEKSVPLLEHGGSLKKGELPNDQLAQLLFLAAWTDYVSDPNAENLESALAGWYRLAADEDFDLRLTELARQEDGNSAETALKLVNDAEKVIELNLLQSAVRRAEQAWTGGRKEEALQLLTAVGASPLSEDAKSRAFAAIHHIGEELASEVEALAETIPTYTTGFIQSPPPVVGELKELAAIIAPFYPAAKLWMDAALGWSDTLANRIWDAVLREIEVNNYQRATEMTALAIELAGTESLKSELTQALRKMEGNLDYDGVTPVYHAPAMWTLNGFGTKVYTMGTFPSDRRFEIGILYIVFFFIPVIPLARYLVQSEGSAFRFFAKTKWTKAMHIHTIISCIVLIFAFIGIANSPPTSAEASTTDEYSAPANYYNPGYPDTEWAGPRISSDSLVRLGKLNLELDELDRKIVALQAKLDKQEANVKAWKQKLNKERAYLKKHRDDSDSNAYIRSYNRRVDAFNAERARFNKAADEYISAVKREQKYFARRKEIETAIENEDAGNISTTGR